MGGEGSSSAVRVFVCFAALKHHVDTRTPRVFLFWRRFSCPRRLHSQSSPRISRTVCTQSASCNPAKCHAAARSHRPICLESTPVGKQRRVPKPLNDFKSRSTSRSRSPTQSTSTGPTRAQPRVGSTGRGQRDAPRCVQSMLCWQRCHAHCHGSARCQRNWQRARQYTTFKRPQIGVSVVRLFRN